MVIFGAIFLLTTLLILYSSNSSNDIIYGSIHVAGHHRTVKTTDLKKWAGKEGYVPVSGNKVDHVVLNYSHASQCKHCSVQLTLFGDNILACIFILYLTDTFIQCNSELQIIKINVIKRQVEYMHPALGVSV